MGGQQPTPATLLRCDTVRTVNSEWQSQSSVMICDDSSIDAQSTLRLTDPNKTGERGGETDHPKFRCPPRSPPRIRDCRFIEEPSLMSQTQGESTRWMSKLQTRRLSIVYCELMIGIRQRSSDLREEDAD